MIICNVLDQVECLASDSRTGIGSWSILTSCTTLLTDFKVFLIRRKSALPVYMYFLKSVPNRHLLPVKNYVYERGYYKTRQSGRILGVVYMSIYIEEY